MTLSLAPSLPASPMQRARSRASMTAATFKKMRERDRFFGEPARLEDPPLSVVEHGERRGEGLAAAAELLACGECRLLVGMLVDQPVSPLASSASPASACAR